MKTFALSFLKIGTWLLLAMKPLLLSGQTSPSVNISINIIPPYSPYYADYAGTNASKVLLILQNQTNQTQTVKLKGKLEGDNGVLIRTKANYVPMQPIVLNPNETKQLNGLALRDIFDLNALEISGISKNQIAASSRLPEGNYDFCVQALDMNSNQLLSAEAPLGCTSISVQFPDAPILISPAMGSQEFNGVPQVVNFIWANAGNVPPTIQYVLQVAEMPDKVILDPNQLLNAASFPLINRNVTGTSALLGPADPPLQAGRRYAWRVKAVDPTGQTVFKNDGISGANVFTYGQAEQPAMNAAVRDIPIILPKPADFGKPLQANNKYPLYIRWDGINETPANEHPLRYEIVVKDKSSHEIVDIQTGYNMLYYQEQLEKPKLFDGHAYEFMVTAYDNKQDNGFNTPQYAEKQMDTNSKTAFQQDQKMVAQSMTGSFIYQKIVDTVAAIRYQTLNGKVQYRFESEATLYPLVGNIRLSKYYRQIDADGNIIKDHIPVASVNPEEPAYYLVNSQSDGTFKAEVQQTPTQATADLQPCYSLDFPNNPYYGPTDKQIEPGSMAGSSVDVGEYTSMLRSYQLNLHLKKGYGYNAGQDNGFKTKVTEALSGLRVTIYRESKAAGVPLYEGGGKSTQGTVARQYVLRTPGTPATKTVEIIASDTTRIGASGGMAEAVVSFKQLLLSAAKEDIYWVHVYHPKTGEVILDEPFRFTPFSIPGKGNVKGYSSYVKKSAYAYEVEKNINWTTKQAPVASVKGRLLYKYADGIGGARPLANASIRIEPFLVLTERKAGGRSYVFPANYDQEKINTVDGSNQPRVANDEDQRFFGYKESTQQFASTTTQSDGSFEFKDIPLWDSVTLSGNLYSFFIPDKIIEAPKPEHPATQLTKDMLMASLTGNKADGEAAFKKFVDMVERSTTEKLQDPFNPLEGLKASVQDRFELTKNRISITDGSSYENKVNTGNMPNGYDANFDKNTIKPAVKLNLNKFGYQLPYSQYLQAAAQHGPSAPVPVFAPANIVPGGVGSDGPCTAKLVYRIVVNNKDVYCSPENDILINPLQTLDAGMLYSVVKTVRVNAKVYNSDGYVKENGDQNNKLINIPVELRRKHIEPGLQGEGETFNHTAFAETPSTDPYLIDYQGSLNDGITFNHVLQNRSYSLEAVIHEDANNATSYKPGKIDMDYSTIDINEPLLLKRDFLFNNEFTEHTVNPSLLLEPDQPVLAGRLVNRINQAGIATGGVILMLPPSPMTPGGIPIPLPVDKDGYFSFKSGLLATFKGVRLYVVAYGYRTEEGTEAYSLDIDNLQSGSKRFQTFFFTPSAVIQGYVVNANNENLPSLVKLANTDFVQETTEDCKFTVAGSASPNSGFIPNSHFKNLLKSECKEVFNVYTSPGLPTEIVIMPNDLKYFEDTIRMTAKSGLNTFGKVSLLTREHRIRFKVVGPQGEPIPGATIQLLDQQLQTDETGRREYSFMNISEKNFWAKITPPAGSNYRTKQVAFENAESKGFVDKVFVLEPGISVSGTVTLNGKALPNAQITVNNGEGVISTQTASGTDGAFVLTGIHPDFGTNFSVTATGPDDNLGTIVGQTLSYNGSDLHFELSLAEGIDVRHLLGYEVAIEKLSQQSPDEYLISGTLNLNKAGQDFKLLDEQTRVGFSNIRVKLGNEGENGLRTAEPVDDITLNAYSLTTRFNGAYNALLSGVNHQLIIKKGTTGTGSLTTQARIVDNSFNFPSSYLKFKDNDFYFAVNQDTSYSNNLSLFSTAKTETKPSYHFTNADGGDIIFTLLDFDAHSTAAQTYFMDGKIRLLPTIKATGIQTLGSPIQVNLPELLIDQQEVPQVNGSQAIEVSIENWKIRIPKWRLSTEEGGIVADKTYDNVIRTGALDIPFKTFRLRNDALLIDDTEVKKLSIGGLMDVSLQPDVVPTFGLDQKTGIDQQPHYILRLLGTGGSAAGSLSGLEGFQDPIDIQAATLVSSGEQYIDFSPNSQATTAFNIVGFKPAMIESAVGSFSIMGQVDLGIPRLAPFYGGFKYTRNASSGQIECQTDFKNINFDIGKGYVQFTSPVTNNAPTDPNRKLVKDGNVRLYGSVFEPNGQLPNLPVVLSRDGSGIRIDYEPVDGKQHALDYGDQTRMLITQAGTKVVEHDWDYLTFSGVLRKDGKRPDGFNADNELRFKVYGEVAYDSGSISVSNTNTPFGSMNMVFDWPNKRILGNLKMDGVNIAAVSVSGEAEILIDKNGFYTFIAGSVDIPVPLISPFKAGFLLGKYNNLPNDVIQRTMQFNHNKIMPSCAQPYNFAGFLVAGRKDLFETIDFSLDLPPLVPIVSASLVAECGVDAALFMNFATDPQLTLQVGAFGKVGISIASITGTSASGSMGVDLTGRVNYLFSQKQLNADFCNGINLHYEVKQSIFGLKDFKASGDISLSAKAGLVNTSPYFRLSKESCSSSEPCQTK